MDEPPSLMILPVVPLYTAMLLSTALAGPVTFPEPEPEPAAAIAASSISKFVFNLMPQVSSEAPTSGLVKCKLVVNVSPITYSKRRRKYRGHPYFRLRRYHRTPSADNGGCRNPNLSLRRYCRTPNIGSRWKRWRRRDRNPNITGRCRFGIRGYR